MVMAGFVVLAVLLGLAVLGGALWPLWRAAPRFAAGLLLALGLAAFGLYRLLGTPAALDPAARQAATMPRDFDQAVQALREALAKDPARADGWALLGRSLLAQDKPGEAEAAFVKALALAPDDPDLLVEAASTRAAADPQHRFDARAEGWLRQALQRRPDHPRALWFTGVMQRQRGQAAEAARTWESLLPGLDARTAASLREQIDAARADAGQAPLPPPAAAAADSNHEVRVHVALGPGVSVPAGASVFVIARVPGGAPMPVAVQRRPASALPLELTLSDADSPMPTQKLSALGEVELLARLSASGDALRGAGDIESAPVRVALPAKAAVELTLAAPER
ncbi:MAG: tetratricopeptide repeat protein [Pseudoxanthomonas sp.]